MRRRRPWTLAGVSAVVAGLAVVSAVLVLADRSTPNAARRDVATRPVYFDGGTVFTPRAVPTDSQDLTADEAWTTWEHGDHLTADITPEFGVLTDRGHSQLAWAFSQRGCMMPLGFPTTHEVALAKSPACRLWTFLDPRTGRHILTTDLEPTEP